MPKELRGDDNGPYENHMTLAIAFQKCVQETHSTPSDREPGEHHLTFILLSFHILLVPLNGHAQEEAGDVGADTGDSPGCSRLKKDKVWI